jgi:hypothetical protein
MSSAIETISGAKGAKLITGVTAVTRNFNSIQMNGDTVIAELYYDEDTTFATNVAGSAYLNLAGNSIASGLIILAEAGKNFAKIKLTSGSVLIH